MNRWTVVSIVGALIVVAGIVLVFIPDKEAKAPTAQEWVTQRGEVDMLRNISVAFGERITSPLVIEGEARGVWFFEASFPVDILDEHDNPIAQGYAMTADDWMTTEYVRFESVPLVFPPQPAGSAGTVVLYRDNPSGLPEHDDALLIPVVFK